MVFKSKDPHEIEQLQRRCREFCRYISVKTPCRVHRCAHGYGSFDSAQVTACINLIQDDSDVSVPNIPAFSYFTASTYTGIRFTPCDVGAKTYQRFSCSTNAKK